MKKVKHLLLSCFVLTSITSGMAQDQTQLALDIAAARAKSTEQLMNYSWQRTIKIFLNEEEKIHNTVKVWFNDEGKMEGSYVGSESSEEQLNQSESMEQRIGLDYTILFEQTFELVVNYVFLSTENWIELMDNAVVSADDDVVKIELKNLLVQGDEIHIIIDNNTKLYKSIKLSSSVNDIPIIGSLEFETMSDGTNYPIKTEIIIPKQSMKITTEIIASKTLETMKTKNQSKKDENKGSLTKAWAPWSVML